MFLWVKRITYITNNAQNQECISGNAIVIKQSTGIQVLCMHAEPIAFCDFKMILTVSLNSGRIRIISRNAMLISIHTSLVVPFTRREIVIWPEANISSLHRPKRDTNLTNRCTVNVKYSMHGAYIEYDVLNFEYFNNFEYDNTQF